MWESPDSTIDGLQTRGVHDTRHDMKEMTLDDSSKDVRRASSVPPITRRKRRIAQRKAYLIRQRKRAQEIGQTLSRLSCCCCSLRTGLTLGFVTIMIVCIPFTALATNIFSILQVLLMVIGLIGLWNAKRSYLRMVRIALIVDILFVILQVVLMFILQHQTGNSIWNKFIGYSMNKEKIIIGIMSVGSVFSIALHIWMIKGVSAAIAVMDVVKSSIRDNGEANNGENALNSV